MTTEPTTRLDAARAEYLAAWESSRKCVQPAWHPEYKARIEQCISAWEGLRAAWAAREVSP